MCRKPRRSLEAEVQHQQRSRMYTRCIAIFSFLFCVISLIINCLCLFSGNESAYMRNSSMVSVRGRRSRASSRSPLPVLMGFGSDKRPQINTTLLGYDLLQPNSSNANSVRTIQTIPGSSDSTNPVTAQVNESTFTSRSTNVAAETQSAELGIRQWYSLDILSVCEGSYSPSAFLPGAELEVRSCVSKTPMSLHPPMSKTTFKG